ncbi:MAG: ribosome small subunit-dependent GTPase A [Tepidisphaeraceae bacterium]
MGQPKKHKGQKDPTAGYLAGQWEEEHAGPVQRFGKRSKFNQQMKTERTAKRREEAEAGDVDALPIGRVVQVFSLYSEVEYAGTTRLCVVRKTLNKVRETQLVVGDRVRFRESEARSADGKAEGVIERIEPRETVLTRADSFKAIVNHPIVANAQQMLIVAAVVQPRVKWGLIDRMLVAAQCGGLVPIVCLNKVDLAEAEDAEALDDARAKLAHYSTLGIKTLETSVPTRTGVETLRDLLRDKVTVLAGHSGVGKSSLIRAVQPSLDLRVGEISQMHQKGKHTTTSARIYPLEVGGEVIDTPGVKLFGLWSLDADSVDEFFPDVASETAPEWRVESYQRILESLAGDTHR